MRRPVRLAEIPGFGIDEVAEAAGNDPEVLRLENLDTDLPVPPGVVDATRRAVGVDEYNSFLPFDGRADLKSAVAAHVGSLTDSLASGLARLGVEVVTLLDPDHRSGITTFTLGSQERNVEAMRYLLDRRILTSVRYTSGVGGVRVSCHLFNNGSDVDRLLEHLRGFLNGAS